MKHWRLLLLWWLSLDLLAGPAPTSTQQWQYELGGASLVRKAPWHQQETHQLNVPMFSARYGGWALGTGDGLITYRWQGSSGSLSSGIGLRDESVNSAIWGDADDERYDGFDGGDLEVTANLGAQWHSLSLNIGQDISGHSDGTTAELLFTRPLYAWPGRFTPKSQWFAGARWLSQSYSQSVFGIDEQHASADLPVYEAQAASNPLVGMQLMWPFTEYWQMRFKYRAEWLDQTLQDSPLVARSVQHTAYLTFVYLGF